MTIIGLNTTLERHNDHVAQHAEWVKNVARFREAPPLHIPPADPTGMIEENAQVKSTEKQE